MSMSVDNYMSSLMSLIAQKYISRPAGPDGPQPIEITTIPTGPLTINGGFILCDQCGTIIRQTYLSAHRSSGACGRTAEKRKLSMGKASSTTLPPSNQLPS